MHPVLVGVGVVLAFFVLMQWRKARLASRAEFIRTYRYPPGLFEKLRKQRPQLSLKDCQLVGNALRQYFLAHLKSGRKFVSMPSQVTDDLWHELILYTRNYDTFCRQAFGRFMHHTPAVVLGRNQQDNAGLRRTWWYACQEEHINPRKATRLPLLFAIDSKLGIADGFRYVPDCKSLREQGDGGAYCGGDFEGGDYDWGNDSDSGGFDFSSSDGGSDGCGGGCGGGGD